MPWSVSARLAALMYDAAGGIPEDFEAAIGRLQKLEPTNPKIPHAAAAAFERHGLRDRQIVSLEKARSLDPHSPRLLLEHARALEAAGREDEAVQCWAEMVAVEFSPYGRVLALPQMVEPSYAFAHAALGRRAEQRGREWRARRHYRRAVEILERYFSSLEQMRPVLEAGGLADPRLEQEARSVLLEVRQALKRLPDTPGPERRGPDGWVPGPPPSRRP
jgi:tetratricopeptide (TPR) repeat protein